MAILLVLVFHYFVQSTQTSSPFLGFAVSALRLGFTGVDLFFVLSGFLIGGILYDSRCAENYYRTFYARRLYRILPAYYLLLLCFFAGLFLVHIAGPQIPSYAHRLFNRALPAWSYPFFVQNFFAASRRQWGAEFVSATWSLAIEEQFYLLLPFVIRSLSPKRILPAVLSAILLAPVVRGILVFTGNSVYGPYTLLPCRMDALGFGVLLALAYRNPGTWAWFESRRRYLYGAFVILGLGLAFMTYHPSERLVSTLGYSWIGLFYSSLMLLVIARPGRIERFVFGSPLLVRLGKYAYSIYLFHYPIFGLCHLVILGAVPSVHDWRSLCVTVIALAITIGCAALLWRFFEGPLIRRAHDKFVYITETNEPEPAVIASI